MNKNIMFITLFISVGFILGSITGGYVGYNASTKATEATLEAQKDVINKAIEKETNVITNSVTSNFDKIKSQKSQPINITIDPTTRSVISSADTSQLIHVHEEKGFFKRLFNKKK